MIKKDNIFIIEREKKLCGVKSLKPSDKVENFELDGVDENGNFKKFSLNDFKDKNVVLYFYPKDDTSLCTQQALEFQKNLNKFKNRAKVIGISPDSLESHQKFHKRNNLSFPLLSDQDHKIAKKFNAFGKQQQGIIRSTFLINKYGVIEKIWDNVKPKGHVEQILRELNS